MEQSARAESAVPKRMQIGVGGFLVTERAKEMVMAVLDSNRLTAGPMMKRFESEMAQFHGRKHGLMCNSGTSALHIALAALMEIHDWQPGDEVLVPAVTFIATSNVVIQLGLKPVFVDIEPDYYTIDPTKIEARITPKTRAIMPVHIAGLPCDMDPILEIARKHDLRIVEDSCESMFVNYRGRSVGSFGDVGCFSTYAAHMITTGVGGVCVTDDPQILEIMKSWMNHGRDSVYTRIDDDEAAHGDELFRIANNRFTFVRMGHSFRATEMEAALGVAQIEDRVALAAHRRSLVKRLNEGLGSLSRQLQLPCERPGAEHAYMFYPIKLIDPKISRDDLILYLEERSIETRYVLPLINQPVYRKLFGDLDEEYPEATRINKRAFYIGCHPEMNESDVDYVVRIFHEFFEENK